MGNIAYERVRFVRERLFNRLPRLRNQAFSAQQDSCSYGNDVTGDTFDTLREPIAFRRGALMDWLTIATSFLTNRRKLMAARIKTEFAKL
jgi:hypothetical protein